MLFQSYEGLDWVHGSIAPRLEKMIEARQRSTWAGDNEELELWKANGFRAVPLAATDIPPGLKTDLIDAAGRAALSFVESVVWVGEVHEQCEMGR